MAMVLDDSNSVPVDGWYELLRAMVLRAQRDIELPTGSGGKFHHPSADEQAEAELFLLWMEDHWRARA